MEWQPIETAPKNGRDLILWFPKIKRVQACAWKSPNGYYAAAWSADGQWIPYEPTHWMPMPDPPRAEA